MDAQEKNPKEIAQKLKRNVAAIWKHVLKIKSLHIEGEISLKSSERFSY